MTGAKLPALLKGKMRNPFHQNGEILYKILFDMKNDMNDLKKLVFDLIRHGEINLPFTESSQTVIEDLFRDTDREKVVSKVSEARAPGLFL